MRGQLFEWTLLLGMQRGYSSRSGTIQAQWPAIVHPRNAKVGSYVYSPNLMRVLREAELFQSSLGKDVTSLTSFIPQRNGFVYTVLQAYNQHHELIIRRVASPSYEMWFLTNFDSTSGQTTSGLQFSRKWMHSKDQWLLHSLDSNKHMSAMKCKRQCGGLAQLLRSTWGTEGTGSSL